MGACLGLLSPKDAETIRSDEISRAIEEERRKPQSEERLLLLGPGECGKSTIVKQMKIIYSSGFKEEEKKHFRDVIRLNAVRAVSNILQAMKNLGILFENEDLEPESSLVRDFHANYDPYTDSSIPKEICDAIGLLWKDRGLQSCYMRSNEYQLIDSAKYFIEKVREVAKDSYVPSQEDIIRAREQTQGVVEVDINIETSSQSGKFKIIDVGGQRTQRKKWLNAFDGVTALIFVASLIDYDLKLQEDERRGTNRMNESLVLFSNTIHTKYFQNKSIVLFLNKTDLFKDKVARSPIDKYFKDYTGGADYKSGAEYFIVQFTSKNSNEDRKIYPHLTCATDTEALGHLINVVADTIIQQNLAEVGLM